MNLINVYAHDHSTTQNMESFSHPRKFPQWLFLVNSFVAPPPKKFQGNLILIFITRILYSPFLAYKTVVMQYIIFFVSLLSYSIMVLDSYMAFCVSLVCFYCWIIFHWMNILHCVYHSSAVGHLDFLQILAVMNSSYKLSCMSVCDHMFSHSYRITLSLKTLNRNSE